MDYNELMDKTGMQITRDQYEVIALANGGVRL